MRAQRICGAPLLSAAALYVAWYPLDQDWVVWIALVPLLVWLDDDGLTRAERAFGLALFGAVHHAMLASPFVSVEWWGWGETTEEGAERFVSQQRVFVGILLAAVSLWLGAYFAVVGHWLRGCRRSPLLAAFLVPSVWFLLVE